MDQARRKAGKPVVLATALEKRGLTSARTGKRYSDQTVNNWGRGDVMPGADVLIAAAHITGIDVDVYVKGDASLVSRIERLEKTVTDVLDEVRQSLRSRSA